MRKNKYKEFEKANEIEQMKEAFGMAVWGRRRREFREMGSLSVTYSQRQCEENKLECY